MRVRHFYYLVCALYHLRSTHLPIYPLPHIWSPPLTYCQLVPPLIAPASPLASASINCKLALYLIDSKRFYNVPCPD